MEKQIVLGSVGELDLALSGGVLTIKEVAAVPGDAGVSEQAGVQVDAAKLLEKLGKLIEAKSPAGAVPVEELVLSGLITAVKAIQ